MPNNEYPQQQGAYPPQQQGPYPPQQPGAYPPQNPYPQQQCYPPQQGYAQQPPPGAYPQQQQLPPGAYPQQQGPYPPQQPGYYAGKDGAYPQVPPPGPYQQPPGGYYPPQQGMYNPYPQQGYGMDPNYPGGVPPMAGVGVPGVGMGGPMNPQQQQQQQHQQQLGKEFTSGNVIALTSISSKQNLRIRALGPVDGCGGTGPLIKFVVERVGAVGEEKVKLKSGATSKYLAIKSNQLVGVANSDPDCEFWVRQSGPNTNKPNNNNNKPTSPRNNNIIYAFESVTTPGSFIGIQKNGKTNSPNSTKIGDCGGFRVTVIKGVGAGGGGGEEREEGREG